MKKDYGKAYKTIYVTEDYSIFNKIESNRKLNERNLSKLLKSFESGQMIIPILVNENYEVIDGQHRLHVCQKLKLPVYYYMVEGYGKEELAKAQVSAMWSNKDYLNYGIKEDNENYIWLSNFSNSNNISIPSALKIYSSLSNNNEKCIKMLFENGNLVIEKEIRIKMEDFMSKLQDFKKSEICDTKNFISAFLILYSSELFNHDTMKKKITTKTINILNNTNNTIHDFLVSLVDIYNLNNKVDRLAVPANRSQNKVMLEPK